MQNLSPLQKIAKLIEKRHLFAALTQLQSYLRTLNDQSLFNRWHSINENYKYLLNYFLAGQPDDNREHFFHGLQDEAYQLVDEVHYQTDIAPRLQSLEQLYLHLQQQYNDNPDRVSALKCAFYHSLFAYPEEKQDAYIITYSDEEQLMAIYGLASSLFIRFSKTHFLSLCRLSQQLDEKPATLCLSVVWLCAWYYPHRVSILDEWHEMNINRPAVIQTILKNIMSLHLTSQVSAVFRQVEKTVAPEIRNKQNIIMLEDIEDDAPQWMESLSHKVEKHIDRLHQLHDIGADIHFHSTRTMLHQNFFREDLSNWFMPFCPENVNLSDEHIAILRTMSQECTCSCDTYAYALLLKQIGKEMLRQLPETLSTSLREPTANDLIKDLICTLFRLSVTNSWFMPNLFESIDASIVFYTNEDVAHDLPLPAMQLEELAEYAFKVGLFAEAAAEYRSLRTSLSPLEQVEYLQKEALAFEKLNEQEEAARLYEQALLIEPNSFTKKHLALAYAKSCQYEKAIHLYDELLQTTEPNTATHKRHLNNKAWCLRESECWNEALQVLMQMEVLYPNDTATQRDLAWTALYANRWNFALTYSQQVAMSEDGTAKDWICLALAQYKTNISPLPAFQRAVETAGGADKFVKELYAETPRLYQTGFDASTLAYLTDAVLQQHYD